MSNESSAATKYDRMREHIDILNAEIIRLRTALARVAQHTGFATDTPSWRDIAREALKDAE
jgi:hypothetical protein